MSAKSNTVFVRKENNFNLITTCISVASIQFYPVLRIWIRIRIQIRIICADPDPDRYWSLQIRIRVQNLSKNVINTLTTRIRSRSQIRSRIRIIEICNQDPDPYQNDTAPQHWF